MIKIKNRKEPLVKVTDYCPNVVNGFEDLRKRYGADMYLRKSVAEMLARAQKYLPQGVTFIILDAWRPEEAQLKFYDYYLKKFQKENPGWSLEKAKTVAGIYAISPENLYKAGHLTGGAIDLELWKNGRRLPIMARSVDFSKAVKTDSVGLPPNVKSTRKILVDAMTKAGFVNYPNEYWHWCYGDYMWAELTGAKSTIYSKIDFI